MTGLAIMAILVVVTAFAFFILAVMIGASTHGRQVKERNEKNNNTIK